MLEEYLKNPYINTLAFAGLLLIFLGLVLDYFPKNYNTLTIWVLGYFLILSIYYCLRCVAHKNIAIKKLKKQINELEIKENRTNQA